AGRVDVEHDPDSRDERRRERSLPVGAVHPLRVELASGLVEPRVDGGGGAGRDPRDHVQGPDAGHRLRPLLQDDAALARPLSGRHGQGEPVLFVGRRTVLRHAAEHDGLVRIVPRVPPARELPAVTAQLPPAGLGRIEVLGKARMRRLRLQPGAGPRQRLEVDRLADLLAVELRPIAAQADADGLAIHRPPIGAGRGWLRARRPRHGPEYDGDHDRLSHDGRGLSHGGVHWAVRLGLIVVLLAVLSYPLGLALGVPALLPVLNAAPAYGAMVVLLRRGELRRAVVVMLVWAAALAVTGTFTFANWPQPPDALILHGP